MMRTESEGEHATTAYPLMRVVGCSCGFTRTQVAPEVMDAILEAHLISVGVITRD